MIGMIPYSFTVTSHIIVTFALAAFIFVGVTVIGFIKHGFWVSEIICAIRCSSSFITSNCGCGVISYLSRLISLSVRLFANMMAGHTMLKVFGGFVISLGLVGVKLPLAFCCINRFGDTCCFSTSLRFCNFNMHLFK